MERDFLGLGVKVKQEIPQEITDFSIGMKLEKYNVGFEALGSASLMTTTTEDAVEPSISPYSSIMQQNAFDSPFRNNRYQEALRVASISSPAGQNLACSTNPQPKRPFQAKNSSNAVVGTTELRNSASTQLTVFYAGSVFVYDDVSSEKAQAIMLLAGNGPPSVPPSPVQKPAVRPSNVDCSVVNRCHNVKSSVPSQISPVSMSCPQSIGRSVFTDDAAAVRTIGTLRSLPSKQEPPKAVTVPQFRKASLARFLAKRKERVINASPYSSDERQFAVNSSGSCPLPTTT